MQDEAIGQTSDAGAIRIVEAAAIDGCYGIVLFRDAGSGIPLLIDVFCRSDFDTFRIRDLQQIPDEAGCLDLFQLQRRIRARLESEYILLIRRRHGAEDLVQLLLIIKPRDVLRMP